MEALLKFLSVFMIMSLISIQIFLTSPYRSKLTDDSINGRVLQLYEPTILRGTIELDAIGEYISDEVLILVNGKPHKLVTVFPIKLDLCEGDVVEVQLKKGQASFYVFLLSSQGQIKSDLKSSTVLVEQGINYLFAVRGYR